MTKAEAKMIAKIAINESKKNGLPSRKKGKKNQIK